jgi:hypothetical protein
LEGVLAVEESELAVELSSMGRFLGFEDMLAFGAGV